MAPEQTVPFAGRLEREKVDYVEQEGWSLSLAGCGKTSIPH